MPDVPQGRASCGRVSLQAKEDLLYGELENK